MPPNSKHPAGRDHRATTHTACRKHPHGHVQRWDQTWIDTLADGRLTHTYSCPDDRTVISRRIVAPIVAKHLALNHGVIHIPDETADLAASLDNEDFVALWLTPTVWLHPGLTIRLGHRLHPDRLDTLACGRPKESFSTEEPLAVMDRTELCAACYPKDYEL